MVKLGNLLRDVQPKKFNMGIWGRLTTKRAVKKVFKDIPAARATLDEPIKCNTAACIAGWGTAIVPELKLVVRQALASSGAVYNEDTGHYADAAFADAFGITDDESKKLCVDARDLNDNSIDTPDDAADAVFLLAEKYAKGTGYEVVDA